MCIDMFTFLPSFANILVYPDTCPGFLSLIKLNSLTGLGKNRFKHAL